MTIPRACFGCRIMIPSGTYCTNCKRATKKVRNDDRELSRSMRQADPICRCNAHCRWHLGRSECGITTDLTADHVMPLVHGGTNDGPRQVLCRRCNSNKRSSLRW